MRYRALMAVYRLLRQIGFTRDRPDGPYLVVDDSIDTIRAALGQQYFGPNWTLSYYKRNEDLNLARVVYVRGAWWQVHVRGWDHDGQTYINAHYEMEPSEHPSKHINAIGFDEERGMAVVEEMLMKQDIDITKRVESLKYE